MKFKLFLFLLAPILIFTSCKKNNSNTAILGTWSRIEMTTVNNGQSTDVPIPEENTLTFESCEGNDDWCPSVNTYDGSTFQVEYQVSEDESTLTVRSTDGSQQQVYSIIELNSTELKLSSVQQGGNLITTYEKI